VLLQTLLALLREASPWSAWLAMLLLGLSAVLKWGYWLRIDGELRAYTLEAATGLGQLGRVRVLDSPHTQPNFVMREMGYRVARKHAQKLRKAALLFAFGLPIVFLLISQAPGLAVAGALLATLSLAAGLLIERWLFFAEAEHLSMLYYGEACL
jgi:DMSO reductase anchor subunit